MKQAVHNYRTNGLCKGDEPWRLQRIFVSSALWVSWTA